jgi:hypothetical protein
MKMRRGAAAAFVAAFAVAEEKTATEWQELL